MKKVVSTKEQKRRKEQSWRAKGGTYLDDGDGGVVRATPIKLPKEK